jgi:hypothetical protein
MTPAGDNQRVVADAEERLRRAVAARNAAR